MAVAFALLFAVGGCRCKKTATREERVVEKQAASDSVATTHALASSAETYHFVGFNEMVSETIVMAADTAGVLQVVEHRIVRTKERKATDEAKATETAEERVERVTVCDSTTERLHGETMAETTEMDDEGKDKLWRAIGCTALLSVAMVAMYMYLKKKVNHG